ncbi:bifunctional diaminohydroxyphosphoribosylaminopyrimidine deaminase/5-amino-6-(5-phosphoribosylamino)uracil reductase RibD [Bordetella petrii]|uniref:Riboflavin biosynthesis protein RibD n=1 Tax=Bordetella petrii (strain ATCC BAA-461 / DSM 12804 / CCUG 43448 / CIP 107267 / Se-1111R) TaxID=340100 RepID=A9I298_BORPD|nr:bifunctional diaminohydroxyphosphoribosylaminopyrimidine deaminase/5-amino-6-(5-phosphoribosylamino)uracil reductase RibD [Bordetella petrii]CAP40948.1 diaminohydroxyphosphoribosylaminopyrimidine deaminase / 5-amino-6-(5-phosphoribosylamino)uracil reductase [Bordetella petrii]
MTTLTDPDDLIWMRRALALARTVMYTTTPNPRVGCVIVRDGRVLGEGATQPPGGPHAEICALRDAAARGESVQGATLYVTLEPCSHYGRTPPCADAVAAAGPARVVVAMGDPNPQVRGQGLARLRAAGIAVTSNVCLDEALEINAGFVARMSRGIPWAWVKMAASLDGRSALHNGVSQWITGEAARADGHAWRARSCVVLTGMGTVLKDNPRLNVRAVETPRAPRKAVVDGDFAIPEDARLFDGAEVIIFTARTDAGKAARLAARNARVVALPGQQAGRVDLPAMMRWLGEHEFNEVHVEAGAGLGGALMSAGCIDELLVYLAPVLLGDAAAMLRLPLIEHLDHARRLEFTDTARIGPDLRLRARDSTRWQALREAAMCR